MAANRIRSRNRPRPVNSREKLGSCTQSVPWLNLTANQDRATTDSVVTTQAADMQSSAKLIELKDALIILPLVGSSFALSFEVGSFVPMGEGMFSLFSITEYIGFAFQALPAAVAVSCFFIPYAMLIQRVTAASIGAHLKNGRYYRVAFASSITAILFLYVGATLFKFAGTFAFAAAFGAAALVLFIGPAPLIKRPFLLIFWGYCFALLFTFTLGIDSTRMQLNAARSEGTMVFEEGPKSALLLRAGSQGLLFYERASQSFEFRQWNAVKQMGWHRRGIAARMTLVPPF
jgi:hypothetical protein